MSLDAGHTKTRNAVSCEAILWWLQCKCSGLQCKVTQFSVPCCNWAVCHDHAVLCNVLQAPCSALQCPAACNETWQCSAVECKPTLLLSCASSVTAGIAMWTTTTPSSAWRLQRITAVVCKALSYGVLPGAAVQHGAQVIVQNQSALVQAVLLSS